jgi:hypothetical protein
VAWARRHAVDVLQGWRLPPGVIDVATLLVSELSTNAVRHIHPSTAPPFRDFALTLTYHYAAGRLIVEVYDPDRRPPVLKPAGEEAEGGRGLLLVQSLSSRWGYTYPTPTSGKVVWCEVEVPRVEASVRTASAMRHDVRLLGRTLAGLQKL